MTAAIDEGRLLSPHTISCEVRDSSSLYKTHDTVYCAYDTAHTAEQCIHTCSMHHTLTNMHTCDFKLQRRARQPT